ncbi:hypothetical protein MASR2M44_03220 [Bacteroidota bacterium]
MQAFIISFILIIYNQLASGSQEGGWRFVHEKEQVKVYVRHNPQLKFNDLLIVPQLDCKAASLLSLLSDVEAQRNYLFGCLESKVLASGKQERQFYQRLYMPWPFSNRDAIYRQRVWVDETKHLIRIESESEANALPLRKDLVRIPFYHSVWEISYSDSVITKARFMLQVDPGGQVPAWLVNLFIDQGPISSVKKIRELVKQEPYRSAQMLKKD